MMTKKQLTAANRMLDKLYKARDILLSADTAGCLILKQVNDSALESNARCIAILEQRVEQEERFAI